jgi:hypothetical protein
LNKIVSIKINILFFSAILIAGTIALSLPSFMAGVQAQQDYGGMDNSYENYYGKDNYKSKDNSVFVKKINCNNINANVNGLELDVLPPALANLLQGDEGDSGASSYGSGERSYGSGGQSGYDNNSFKFICINNNNNTVIADNDDDVIDECPEAEGIEACFEQVLGEILFERFLMALEDPTGITVEINGQEVTLRSFADICSALEGLTFAQLTIAIGDIIAGAGIELTAPSLSGLIQCISTALNIVDHG